MSSIDDAIFRLGRLTQHRRIENDGVLKCMAKTVFDYIGIDMLYLSVHNGRLAENASNCAVLGPWDTDQSNLFLNQSRWSTEDRVLALRLETSLEGELHRRRDLMDEDLFRNSRLFKEFHRPLNLGDHAIAYHRSPQGPAVILVLNTVPADSLIADELCERATRILPALFCAFDHAWKPAPTWTSKLKPQAKRILQHVVNGYDDEQIAAFTGLTYHSVRAHLKRLFKAAEVRSRLHLTQAYFTGQTSESLDRQVEQTKQERESTSASILPAPAKAPVKAPAKAQPIASTQS